MAEASQYKYYFSRPEPVFATEPAKLIIVTQDTGVLYLTIVANKVVDYAT